MTMREELRLNYRCARCRVNFQYPIPVDIWQANLVGGATLITFQPHTVQEAHLCKERIQ